MTYSGRSLPEAVSAEHDADLGFRVISDLLGMLGSFFENGLVHHRIVIQPRLFVVVDDCGRHPSAVLANLLKKSSTTLLDTLRPLPS
jgi:hypothetical protein